MDWINVPLSIGALVISLISLYVSVRTANRTWERQSKLPYYKDLTQFVESVEELFSHEVGIFRVPNFDNVRHTASSLGLSGVALHLQEMEQLMKIMDKERHHENRDIPKERQHIESVEMKVILIKDFVRADTARLTKTHTLSKQLMFSRCGLLMCKSRLLVTQ